MGAMEEQVRRKLPTAGSRGLKLSHLRVSNDEFDPTRAE